MYVDEWIDPGQYLGLWLLRVYNLRFKQLADFINILDILAGNMHDKSASAGANLNKSLRLQNLFDHLRV